LRIAREALSNAARHAQATLVRLSPEYGDSQVTLRISDNGRGCQIGDCAGDVPGHYGFQIMKERAEQACGQFHVETGDGRGTRIEVAVPA
jgi:signal transduction histidine kinase